MSRLFYDHLIDLEKIHEKLDGYELTNTEKADLLQLIDETIHHEVMNVILTHMPKEHHEDFLDRFSQAPHQKKHITYIAQTANINIQDAVETIVISVMEDL